MPVPAQPGDHGAAVPAGRQWFTEAQFEARPRGLKVAVGVAEIERSEHRPDMGDHQVKMRAAG